MHVVRNTKTLFSLRILFLLIIQIEMNFKAIFTILK